MNKKCILVILVLSIILNNTIGVVTAENVKSERYISEENIYELEALIDSNDISENKEIIENIGGNKRCKDNIKYGLEVKGVLQDNEILNEKNLKENDYEKENYKMFRNYKLNDYNRRKEFELDAEGIKSVYNLKPKTQKNMNLL